MFGYTDDEWEFIWMTMLADGAWAVPSITDNEGNITKDNCAPEILIKYIAHDLRCHIIVFDLNLNRVQFLSGNHVKDNNVVFESPLVLYATGEHFQSVFQTDHEYFINYARELEAANYEEAGSRGSVLEHHNPSFNQNARLSPSQNSAKPSLSKKKETEQSCRSPSISQELTVLERDAIIRNISNIKPRNRTLEQINILQNLRKKIKNEKDKERINNERKNETIEMRQERLEKDKNRKKQMRGNESCYTQEN